VIVRAAAAIGFLLALTAAAGPLTPAQQRGKRLYLAGESAAGRKVVALIGADNAEVAASVVPCASCHGRAGRGKAEGGIRPPSDCVPWGSDRGDGEGACEPPGVTAREGRSVPAINRGVDSRG